jgi:catechol 2,3-dioxygenase-like lactoylglutathione lyase family enzyme
MFSISDFDHVGVRVTDLATAQEFYGRLGFHPDPNEDSPSGRALGLLNSAGLRIHLIYNGEPSEAGNVLMDVPRKWPGYTHAAFVVDDFDALVEWLNREGVGITQGPSVYGQGRRKVCFIRDPDLNVIEFNELLAPAERPVAPAARESLKR